MTSKFTWNPEDVTVEEPGTKAGKPPLVLLHPGMTDDELQAACDILNGKAGAKYSEDQERDEQGRFGSGGGGGGTRPSAGSRPVPRKEFTAKENASRRAPIEHLVVQDKDGNLHEQTMNQFGGEVSEDNLKAVDHGIMSHNHPRGGAEPPSPADVLTGITYDAAEIRVVTARNTYSIRPPEGGWDKTTNGRQEALKSAFSPKIWVDTIRAPSNRALAKILDEHWTNEAKTHGYTYEKEGYKK